MVCRYARLPFAALFALFALAAAPALGAGPLALDVDFSEDAPGEPPASAVRVSGWPDAPVLVVGEGTDPPDPYLRPGNRSLMIQNSDRGRRPGAVFEASAPLARGTFAVEFYLDISHAAEEGGHDFHRSELMVSLDDAGGETGIGIRRLRSNQFLVQAGGETLRLANRPEVNQRNYLLIHFDAEAGTYTGSLNGEPLAVGDRTEFPFAGEAGSIQRVVLEAGHRGMAGSRIFVDRIALAAPGAITEANLLARMPTFNVLPNPSFEEADLAREVYPIIGEYREPGRGRWEIDDSVAWHGERSLKMTGTAPYFWQVMEQVADEWVFSVYLKAAEPGQRLEIGLEKHEYGNEAGIWARGRTIRTVRLGNEWERFVLVGRQDDKERGGNPGSMGSNQYRAWIRPLDGGPVWVDGAQLELDRSEPSPFDPVRRGSTLEPFKVRMMGQTLIDLAGARTELRQPEGAVSGEGSIPLAVRETVGASRSPAPVWGGVPFPVGELFDERQVRLADSQGRAVPLQTKVLARWPRDASVRVLLVDFQSEVPAGGTADYTLHYGGPPAEQGPALAADDGERIVIDTGKAVFTVRRDSFRWFQAEGLADAGDAPPGSYVVGLDGTLYGSAWGEPEEIAIEANGPRRAVVMVRGKHHTKDGERAMLDYEARIHAFADSALLYLEHTFENREPEMNLAVQSHYMRLPVAARGVSAARFGLLGGGTLGAAVAPGQPAALTQVKDYYGEGRYLVLKDQGAGGPARTLEHARAAGTLQAGAAALAVEDFWQLHPKAISAEARAVQVYHWPESHVRFVDLPWGISNTMRLAYAPFGASVEGGGAGGGALAEEGGATVAAEPLLLQPNARWTARSGVFGHYMTAEDAWEKYPGFEFAVSRYFNNLAIDREVTGLTGMWDYGCTGTPYGWRNNETTNARNMWWQYLRTWDPPLRRRAWLKTRHFRDVDILYGGPGSRVVCHHAGGYHTSRVHHTGHYWITGVVWHYLLTGDMRSYKVALESGANLVMRGLGDRRGRNRARPLYHLAELYELSQLEVFRDGFEHTYGFLREGTSGGPMAASSRDGGYEVQAAGRWYSITGDPKFRDDWIAGAEALLDNHRGEGVRTRGGRDTRIFDALAAAARYTGETKFVADVYDLFIQYLASLTGFSDNTVRAGSVFLDAADRMGVPTPETMPDWTLGLPPMTGQTAPEPLRFRVASEPGKRDEPIVLKIYFTREHNRRENDAVVYHVEGADGALAAEGKLEGGDRGGVAVLQLPPTAEGEEYSLTLEYRGNAQGELSSSSRRVFLDGDATFAIRRVRGGLGMVDYYFRAPVESPEIGFTFRLRPNRGDAVGVVVLCPEGKPLASRRWVIPAGVVFNADGERLEDRGLMDAIALRDDVPFMQRGTPITGGSPGWRIGIPERYRGETLSFVMFPQKWMRWRVHGLEDWRLGPTRDSFTPADD